MAERLPRDDYEGWLAHYRLKGLEREVERAAKEGGSLPTSTDPRVQEFIMETWLAIKSKGK